MRSLAIATAFLISLAFTSTARAEKVDKEPPGLAIGKKAPDFELKAQNGKPLKLSTMLKKGPVAVVFHRSANW